LGLEQMPWEQNEQFLQVNTCAKNVEDMSDIKEKIQNLDVKNSPKMRTSIIENSLHIKSSVSNENQKENNPKLDICKESETNISDKNEVIESNSQHLNEANLLPKISEDNRNSSFLDLSSLDIIANDEQLHIPKEKIIFSVIDSSTKIKRNSKNSEQLNFITNDIPNKKLKIFSINEKNNDENLINKDKSTSIISKDVKPSYSRSPSLFDDSLNLDTQMCDILEQNVMDITHLTGLDSKAFVSELDVTNALQKEQSTSPNTGNVQLCDKNNAKGIGAANLQSKNSILSWGDDSWINCEGLLKQIAQDQNIIQSKKNISNSKIKNIVNTNISLALKNTKTCTQSNKENTIKTDIKKRTATVKKKVLRKPKLSREAEIDSPVANIIVFRKERKTSADSNKSDSDDFIVGSQHFESPFSNNKSHTRTTLKKIRKLRSQKLADENILTETNNCLINSSTKEISDDKVNDKIKEEQQEMTSKLKEIPAQNPSASIDSVIYNSEDETANNLTRSILKTEQYETQSNNLDKNVKLKIENVLPDNKKNLLNETIEWSTLNIVKVANNRATFNLFKREILKKRNIALALHCDLYIDNTTNIGSKICTSNAEGKRKSRRSGNYSHGNKEIRGVAISWESNIAYYISFSNSQGNRYVRMIRFLVNAF